MATVFKGKVSKSDIEGCWVGIFVGVIQGWDETKVCTTFWICDLAAPVEDVLDLHQKYVETGNLDFMAKYVKPVQDYEEKARAWIRDHEPKKAKTQSFAERGASRMRDPSPIEIEDPTTTVSKIAFALDNLTPELLSNLWKGPIAKDVRSAVVVNFSHKQLILVCDELRKLGQVQVAVELERDFNSVLRARDMDRLRSNKPKRRTKEGYTDKSDTDNETSVIASRVARDLKRESPVLPSSKSVPVLASDSKVAVLNQQTDSQMRDLPRGKVYYNIVYDGDQHTIAMWKKTGNREQKSVGPLVLFVDDKLVKSVVNSYPSLVDDLPLKAQAAVLDAAEKKEIEAKLEAESHAVATAAAEAVVGPNALYYIKDGKYFDDHHEEVLPTDADRYQLAIDYCGKKA